MKAAVSARLLRFGPYEAKLDTGELWNAGLKIKIQERPFQVLAILLREPGAVVTREALARELWPSDTFVEFDKSINTAVAKLRAALNDTAEHPLYIETIGRRGYRFIATLSSAREAGEVIQTNGAAAAGKAAELAAATNGDVRSFLRSHPHATIAFALLLLMSGVIGGFFIFLALSPTPVPKVVALRRITTTGRVDPWARPVTDGSRIFFLDRAGDHWDLMQTSVAGGEPQVMAAPFRNTRIIDISPDGADFLIGSFTQRGEQMPLWIWPVQGGAPRRVGAIVANDAAWTPDGREIVYSGSDGLYVAERDGSGEHLLAATQERPADFAWSSDGRRLRFAEKGSIWQLDLNSGRLVRVLVGWNSPPRECCGSWTRNGRYFLFRSVHGRSSDIWAIREKQSWSDWHQEAPARLTAGPEEFGGFAVAPAGRRLFVFGTQLKAEVIRYDPHSRQSAAIFPDLQPWSVIYSPDGQWTAVISSSDWTLRRIKPDGTQHLPLTDTSFDVLDGPRWSPDRKQIAFEAGKTGDSRIRIISGEGGASRELMPGSAEQSHPAWSPDGKFLAFDEVENASSHAETRSIKVLELATNRLQRVPGSRGVICPNWSPDGRFLAAPTQDWHKLMLYDFRTQKWTELAEGKLISGQTSWSADSSFIYFQDWLAPNEPVYQMRVADHKVKLIASFEQFLRAGIPRCTFQGIAPDGALIVALLRNHADLYAADLELP